MGYGVGWGGPWSSGPLVAQGRPSSRVGGPPVVYDFRDEPDGPLPGNWERRLLQDDGTGALTIADEALPDYYFRVVDGKAQWRYERDPTNPPPATPFVEHGVVASPVNVIDGSNNAELKAIFVAAPRLALADTSADLFFELMLAFHVEDDFVTYTAGRVAVARVGGVWSLLVVEAVEAGGSAPVVLATADTPEYNSPLDPWKAAAEHELVARFVDGTLTVEFDGALSVSVPYTADRAQHRVGVFIRAYSTMAPLVTQTPAQLVALSFRALRDLAKLGSPPQIEGALESFTSSTPPFSLPVVQLVADGFLKRTGPRTWEFTQAVEVTAFGGGRSFDAGDPVRAVEPYTSQEFVAVVPDLALIRARRER